jgi:hypothetical protein
LKLECIFRLSGAVLTVQCILFNIEINGWYAFHAMNKRVLHPSLCGALVKLICECQVELVLVFVYRNQALLLLWPRVLVVLLCNRFLIHFI